MKIEKKNSFQIYECNEYRKYEYRCLLCPQEKEKLLTDLRTILHITNDQHFKFLEEVMGDKLVTKLRDQQKNGKGKDSAAVNAMPPPPPRQQTPAGQNNISRKNSRPGSAGAKFPPSHTPAPVRQHRWAIG